MSRPSARSEFSRLWAEDPFETALLIGLLGGLAWVPFWLGSNRPLPWGVNGIWFPLLTLCYEASILIRGRRHPVAAKRLLVPAALFAIVLVWILVQMSTLPLSGIIHPIWGMGSDVLGAQLTGSISVNRGATALGLMRLLTDASALWLALQLGRDSKRAHLMLQSIMVIIAVYCLYGLFLAAFYGGGIPFFDVPDTGFYVRSTFVGRNNFATYAGIGLVVALALTLRLYRHAVQDKGDMRSYRVSKLLEATGREGVWMLAAGFVMLVALLGTVSRGGILATALGIFTLLVLSFTRKRGRRSEQIEIILFVTIALMATFVVFGDRIVGRIATSGFGDVGRSAVFAITLRSIFDAPLIGFGYGTFEDIFPLYRDQSMSNYNSWDKAHNTYLEVWQGLGFLVGTALMVAIGLLVLQCFKGAIRRRRDASAAIVAASVALLVGIHALVDFSLQIEAVTLTFMVLLGAGLAQSESSQYAITD